MIWKAERNTEANRETSLQFVLVENWKKRFPIYTKVFTFRCFLMHFSTNYWNFALGKLIL